MTRRIVLGVLLVLVLAAGAVTVGGFAYRAGVMQGMSQNPVIVAPDGTAPDGVPGPWFYYHRPMMWHGGWGWGFGFLQCLVPIFFVFLLMALLRGMFWRGRWGWRHGWGPGGPGGRGPMGWDREKGYPPMFDEWHRKMHEQAEQKADSGQQ